MRAEIVLDQDDGLGVGEMAVGQVLQDVSIVDDGAAIGDREVSPTFERREHHEQVGDAVARVLVIETSWAPRSHRHRQAGLGDQLLRGLAS